MKTAYLTIDDGPSRDWEEKLSFLDLRGIPAVWSCEGQAFQAHPEFAIAAIQRGDVVANHSFDHPTFSETPLEECERQIVRTDELIEAAYSKSRADRSARFFRFPGGDKGERIPDCAEGQRRRAHLQDLLSSLGYSQPTFPGVTYQHYRNRGYLADIDWYWTFDCAEYIMTELDPPTEEACLREIFLSIDRDEPEAWHGLNCCRSEDIILIHDHPESTPLFPRIIERLQEKVCFRSAPLS